MEKKQQVQRGEIVWCDLGEAVGSEQGGCRPVVIVQNDVGNTYSTTTIVVPLTTKIKKTTLPTHYQFVNNHVSQVACAEQIRTVDKVRLGASLGFVRKEDVDAISRCVQIAVGEIEFVPNKHDGNRNNRGKNPKYKSKPRHYNSPNNQNSLNNSNGSYNQQSNGTEQKKSTEETPAVVASGTGHVGTESKPQRASGSYGTHDTQYRSNYPRKNSNYHSTKGKKITEKNTSPKR